MFKIDGASNYRKTSSWTEVDLNLEVLTCGPLICAMNRPRDIVLNQRENSLVCKGIKAQVDLSLHSTHGSFCAFVVQVLNIVYMKKDQTCVLYLKVSKRERQRTVITRIPEFFKTHSCHTVNKMRYSYAKTLFAFSN